jgi:hypothetical protein
VHFVGYFPHKELIVSSQQNLGSHNGADEDSRLLEYYVMSLGK